MARGRPRKTDPDAVLETAMKAFWERGFEGTSMNDLAAITGMAKPGLYANFGDKEALYTKALAHYFGDFGGPIIDDFVRSPDPLDVVLRRFLGAVAASASDKAGPGGCFLVNSLVECANMPRSLEAVGRDFDAQRRAAIARRFKAAKRQGELPADADAKSLAIFFAGQALAIAVMARAGAGKASLDRFIDVAMTALPTVK